MRISYSRLSEEPRVVDWLQGFKTNFERRDAASLVDAMLYVNHETLFEGLRDLILKRSAVSAGMMGLYAEREIRTWKGVPNRLFKEKLVRGQMRAHGGGPLPVQPTRTFNPEVGSEGLISWLITELCREYPEKFTSHPGPDEIRNRKIRTFLLLTDFIGSGGHAIDYLSAVWRIRSVKSWRSGNLLHFETVAYSGLDAGVKNVRDHPTAPIVNLVAACPSIDTAFSAVKAARIKQLCISYDPLGGHPVDSLGHDGGGALIVFGHGCPNNAPRLLHKSRRGRWKALFPRRVTASLREQIQQDNLFTVIVRRLKDLGHGELATASKLAALSDEGLSMVLLLAALKRWPRDSQAISLRTGFTLQEVEGFVKLGIVNAWVDGKRRLTDVGRAHLKDVGAPAPRTFGALYNKPVPPYFPKALRAP